MKTDERPLLVKVEGVAKLLECSESHVWRMADCGRIPQPIQRFGKLKRWSRAVLEAWAANDGQLLAS